MSAPSQQEEQASSNQPQGLEEDNTSQLQQSSAQVIVPPESSMVISTPGQQATSTSSSSALPEKTEWSETRAGQKERQQQQQQQYQQPQQPQQQQQQYREIPSNFQPSRIMGGGQQQPTNVDNQFYQPSPAYLQFQQPSNRMGGQQQQERGGQQQQQQQQPPRPPTIETTYQSGRGDQDQQRRRQQEQQQEDYSALEAKYVPPRAVYRSGTGQRIDELCKKNFSSFNVGFSFFQTSGLQKTGRWIVPRYVSVYLLLSGGGLDMTYAEFVHPQTDIHVYTLMGGYNIMVPPGVRIEAFGGSACGAIQKTQDEIEPILPQSPLVVLHSYVMMGGATISVNRPAQMVHVITADE